MHAIGGLLYVVGGFEGGRIQAYSPATDTWTTAASTIPSGVDGSVCSAEVGGLIYICGGLAINARLNPTDCYTYDPLTEEWTPKASMLQGVDHAATGTDGISM